MPATARRDATTAFFIPHSSKNLSLSNVSPMIPGSLVLKTKAKPDHRASGCRPRRARPFGRAIEVFVASRDDDADYRNAVAQNASLHVVFPQETPFTLTSRPIRPIRNLLNLKLATRSKLFSIE